MARARSSFKMGTVEMIVLFLLEKQDLYGYQLTALIKKLSGEKLVVTESTLYPTLYKLLDKQINLFLIPATFSSICIIHYFSCKLSCL